MLVVILPFLSGCCKKPQCPPCPQPVSVQVCHLPSGPSIPVPERTEVDCPADYVCYDTTNAAKLAGRDSILKQWIREVKARCAPPDGGVDGTKVRPDAEVAPQE